MISSRAERRVTRLDALQIPTTQCARLCEAVNLPVLLTTHQCANKNPVTRYVEACQLLRFNGSYSIISLSILETHLFILGCSKKTTVFMLATLC